MVKKLFKWAFDSQKELQLHTLETVPLFRGLNRRFLRKLLSELFSKEYEAGEIIFSEGETGKAVYIIMDGSVQITKKTESGEQILARLCKGSYFGELALIDQSPRFASATAEEPSHLLIMYKSYFDNLLQGNNPLSSKILMNLLESLSGYLRRSYRPPENQKQDHGK